MSPILTEEMKIKKCAALMAAMLMGAWSLQSCDNGPTKEVWLDEFGQDSCYVQDWGMLEVNRSVVHTPLTVNGVVYERGLGAHSISRLLYDLDGKAVSISGLAGADDKNLFAGKLQFKILGDKKELWKSGVIGASKAFTGWILTPARISPSPLSPAAGITRQFPLPLTCTLC